MKKIIGKRIHINELNEPLCESFFSIYQTYFKDVTYPTFKEHIGHKDAIIILSDKNNGDICGFSTLKLMVKEIEGKKVYGLFSGDTIIDKDYWGEQELVREFSRYAGEIAKDLGDDEKLYWLLISKGFRTYRYLPVFTNNFYPTYKAEWPEWDRKVMTAFYSELYPDEFDPKTCLLTFKENIGSLKEGVGDIDEVRIANPDIAFFAKANPDHMSGVELTCLAELSEENLRSVAKKYFVKGFNEVAECT